MVHFSTIKPHNLISQSQSYAWPPSTKRHLAGDADAGGLDPIYMSQNFEFAGAANPGVRTPMGTAAGNAPKMELWSTTWGILGNLETEMGMDQYLLITFLGEWTSICQLFWGSLGTRVLTHPQMISGALTHRKMLVRARADSIKSY